MHENFLKEKLKCKMIYSNLWFRNYDKQTIVENLKYLPDFSAYRNWKSLDQKM
jgi:hypothetical protein